MVRNPFHPDRQPEPPPPAPKFGLPSLMAAVDAEERAAKKRKRKLKPWIPEEDSALVEWVIRAELHLEEVADDLNRSQRACKERLRHLGYEPSGRFHPDDEPPRPIYRRVSAVTELRPHRDSGLA